MKSLNFSGQSDWGHVLHPEGSPRGVEGNNWVTGGWFGSHLVYDSGWYPGDLMVISWDLMGFDGDLMGYDGI